MRKKRTLLLLVAFLFAACDMRAAAPVIANSGAQHASGFASSASTLSVSLPNNVTAGNMIIVFVGADPASSVTINTPTMTGETFVKSNGASNVGSVGAGQMATFTVNSANGGQKQVTVTLSAATANPHMHVIEVSGQAASPIDATGNANSATMSVSTSASTTTANDLVLAFFHDNQNGPILTATAPYAQVEQITNGGGETSLSEKNTVSATGVQTASASGNGTDTVEQGIIAIAGTGAAAPSGGMNKRQKLEQMDLS
jgi:VCBS repeat-containing protein